MASSCFLQSPCPHSLFVYSSSSSHSSLLSPSHSPFFFSPRNARNGKKLRPAMARMGAETPNDSDICNRRLILFAGISILPLLQLRARALEVSPADISELKATDQKQEVERKIQGGESQSQNPFLSLLNGFGFYGTGVLGALYALARKEKAISDEALESMSAKLEEKEATIVSMGKKFESELLKEKEKQNKQQMEANEEQQALLNRLNSTNITIKNLEGEVQKEKKFVEELKVAMDRLQAELKKAGEEKNKLQGELEEKAGTVEVLQEKTNLQSLEIKDKEESLHKTSTKLAETEARLNELSSSYQRSQSELVGLTSENKELKNEILKKERELESRNAVVDGLEVQLNSLIVERNELNKKLDAIQNDYNNLKSASEKKAASDAMLLNEQQQKLQQLQKQLDIASDEASKSKVIITNLTLEQVDLKKTLDAELDTVNGLKQELQIAQENLEKSRNEVSDLKNELEQSRKLCSELEAEVSAVRADFVKTRESLHETIDEAKRGAELLAAELTATKELLRKTNEEMEIISRELASVSETRDSLQKELVDVYKRAESAANDLKEERNIIANLKKELQAVETQILKDKEVQKSLEADLEETTKSLVELNQNAMVLSKNLELANSTISGLEDEKEMLQKSLSEQKQVSQEARENMEDAHTLVMRLGKERENLEKRAKKLEEELASAKGEILRLRSQMNSSKTPVNDQEKQKVEVAANKATVSTRKYTRRKKSVPEQDDS
ncbi:PREDICTED: MAR-binding filament-like protein 1-1 [Ipomoea nil]|uniref:MAR-binding filament-like protein 1-1 n=1 Tax=Ipomoea nil TaxID=35883 RepID=UPI000900CAF2|nr:PREDICTED: MAR-binding filament-like protein 1-1 [Ipomoea nil]